MPTNRRSRRAALSTGLALALTAVPAAVATASTGGSLPPPVSGAQVFPRPADGDIDIEGGGWGHGVGMSQYGANGAALQGLSHARILAFYYPGTKLVKAASSTIRVGLTVDGDHVLEVRATAGLTVTAGNTKVVLPAKPSRWRVRASGTECLLESLTGTTWSTAKVAGASATTACPVTFTTTGPVPVVLPGGTVRAYDGAVSAVRSGGGPVTTVNTVSMDDYLRSVVPAESLPYFQAAALEAQAVAARTYAQAKIGHGGPSDLCDSTACQVYRGTATVSGSGALTSLEYPSTTRAVAATTGEVLTFGGKPATTMFSSSNGGQTVAVAGFPYLPARADPYDAVQNPTHAWTAKVPVSVLESRYGLQQLQRLQIVSRDGHGQWGGRVGQVIVEGIDAAGRYKSVNTTGSGLAGAYAWPAHRDGIRGNFFQIQAEAPAPSLPPAATPKPPSNPAPRPPATGTYGAYEQYTLKQGSRGSVVQVLQRALHVSADGDFGPQTLAAVVSFQRSQHFSATGVVSASTWRALSSPAKVTAKPTPKPVAKPVAKPAPKPAAKGKYAAYERFTVKQGSRGSVVQVLQRAVHVSADGNFGPRTKAAVVKFQHSRRLSPSGVVSASTWRALGG